MNVVDIIRYIVWYASSNGTRLTTVRLVKFIYLADLYHARFQDGKTLTGFPWKFIYYGPYCSEAWEAIEQAVEKGFVCKETHDSHFFEDKQYSLFWCTDNDAENAQNLFRISVLAQLQQAIKRFGDDTSQLLDFVYFETEPMKDAKKGDLLDFSKAQKPELEGKEVKLKRLSPQTIKLAREKIKKISEEMTADKERLIQDELDMARYKDELYSKFIRFLDGANLETGLTGIARIKLQE